MTTKRTKRKNSRHRHAFKTIKKFALLYLAVKQLKVINTKRYFVRVKVKRTFVNSFFRSTKISDHIFSCACAKSVRPCEGGRRENEVLTANYDKSNWSLVEKKNGSLNSWITFYLAFLLSLRKFAWSEGDPCVLYMDVGEVWNYKLLPWGFWNRWQLTTSKASYTARRRQ